MSTSYYTPVCVADLESRVAEIKKAVNNIQHTDFDANTQSIAFEIGQEHGILQHYLQKIEVSLGMLKQREADTKKVLEVLAVAAMGKGLPENVEPIDQVLKSYGSTVTMDKEPQK